MRFRQGILLVLVGAFGYALGYGPFAEWLMDVWHLVGVEWSRTRDSHRTNGPLPLLAAGFLIGQGLYLLGRRLAASIGRLRERSAERLASWDPLLKIPRRFGIQQYLAQCTRWAAEDPTVRMPSLALFKIHGLSALNEAQGTYVTTRLLERVATEVRAASVPDRAPRIAHWFVRYMPRPLTPVLHRGLPLPRFPARWSGGTFALAFRELDMLQAISVARSVAGWIRSELTAFDSSLGLRLAAGIAIGSAGVSARSLCDAGTQAIRDHRDPLLNVVYDSSDLRGEAIVQISGVTHTKLEMRPGERDEPPARVTTKDDARFASWLRNWGAGLGCFVAAGLLLGFTGTKGPLMPGRYAWPNNLNEVQIVDSAGTRPVRIVRTSLPRASSGGWSVSGTLAQGDPKDEALKQCQFWVTITNRTGRTSYVSAFDFEAYDTRGVEWSISPMRMLRLPDGIDGRWMKPGETWSGWLLLMRGAAPIDRLLFQPDRSTQLLLSGGATPD